LLMRQEKIPAKHNWSPACASGFSFSHSTNLFLFTVTTGKQSI
jgi:hypothetical protein